MEEVIKQYADVLAQSGPIGIVCLFLLGYVIWKDKSYAKIIEKKDQNILDLLTETNKNDHLVKLIQENNLALNSLQNAITQLTSEHLTAMLSRNN